MTALGRLSGAAEQPATSEPELHSKFLRQKTSYIDGIKHSVATLTADDAKLISTFKGVLVMPVTHVTAYDEEREKHMMTIRAEASKSAKERVGVKEFHDLMCKLSKHVLPETFCTYQTYNCATVTCKEKISATLISTVNSFFKKETNGTVFPVLVPHSDMVVTKFETNLQGTKRTIFKGTTPPPPPPPTAVRRVIALSCEVPENGIDAIAELLKCDLVAPQEPEYNLSPLRFVGEWVTQEVLDEVLQAGETVNVDLGGPHVIVEIMPVPKPWSRV